MRSLRTLASRPLFWYAFFIIPLGFMFFMTGMMGKGIPENAPVGIIDKDHTALSRQLTQTLDGMQLITIAEECNSYSEAMQELREGKIYGFFLIPENYEADVLAGRGPAVSLYSNMGYFVPGTLVYKNFKTTAMYTKAGLMGGVVEEATGLSAEQLLPLLNPVTIDAHPLDNPWLNYNYYLSAGFVPGMLQLMVFLLTAYTVLEEIKRRTGPRLLQMAHGSIVKALAAKLLPQTLIWFAVALAMEGWLFGVCHFPMHGSLLAMTVNTLLLVLASQGFALFVCGALPSMRLALSICALVGILTFSLAAFSFPLEEMYPAVGIFAYILPVRYYFLIYINQALDGMPLYYARQDFLAYIPFLLAPFLLLWRLKRAMLKPIYVP